MKVRRVRPAHDVKPNRKLLKPQVERHRRERINRSLESLKALLPWEPWQQETICSRMEKAEILERTVLFLRSSVDRGTNRHFQNGFSACLQQASQFLQNEDEGRIVEQALLATFYNRLSHTPTWDKPTLTAGQSYLQASSSPQRNYHSVYYRRSLAQAHCRVQAQRGVASLSHASLSTHNQTLWRPWP